MPTPFSPRWPSDAKEKSYIAFFIALCHHLGMNSFEEVREAVSDAGGVLTFEAWELRDALEAGRLTRRINGMISETLRSYGLGHVPFKVDDLPTNQYGSVRVYDATLPVGKAIEAAHLPGKENDRLLKESVKGDAAQILAQIRALVEE